MTTTMEEVRAAINEGVTLGLTRATSVPSPSAPESVADLAARVSLAFNRAWKKPVHAEAGPNSGVSIWAAVDIRSRLGRALKSSGFERYGDCLQLWVHTNAESTARKVELAERYVHELSAEFPAETFGVTGQID